MQDSTIHAGARAAEASAEAFPPWLRPTSYWQPAHIVTSAWLEHAPFAFWLVDELRPRSVVELGTHAGFSFFVFAEAVRRLGIDAELTALDTWRGDDQTGFYDEDIWASVRDIAEREYAGFTRLLRGYFSESRPLIPDDSVDLLHIDGRHGYEDAREDYDSWVSAVRDGGVILFHDIAERAPGFGVWRLWEELSAEHPSFAFEHGHGLGVLNVGEVRSPGLAALFDADAVAAREMRSTYERLGSVVSRQAALEAMPAEIESLHAVVEALSQQVDRLQDDVAERDAVIEEILTSTSWAVSRPVRALGRLVRRNGPGRDAS